MFVVLKIIVVAGAIITGLWILFLWFLAIRSLFPRKSPPLPGNAPVFVIIVPAHDEEEVIGRTVEKVLAFDYPPDKFSLYVVADNCTDRTAEIVVEKGGQCLVRHDPVKRGKGHAMAYALEAVQGMDYDAVLFLDADSNPAPDYLSVMSRYLGQGESVIQGRYEVDEPDRNWFTRLTSVSFVLRNKWMFPAFDALGIPLFLRGSGMCFASPVMRRIGWTAHGLTEDMEMTLKLMRENIPITYAPQARSGQYMPPTPEQAASQRLRWSAGESQVRSILVRREIPEAIRQGRVRELVTLLFLVAPAFSVQLCAVMLVLFLSLFAGTALFIICLAIFLAYTAYFIIGFEKPGLHVLSTMAMLPVFALWRAGMVLKAKLRKPTDWVRTSRK